MKYISSDTNVWIDFLVIDELQLPFRLDYTYLMNDDAIGNELIEPKGLSNQLLEYGLVATEMTTEEFFLAEELNARYAKPSVYDCVALAIAKNRGIILLSGDGPLRKAAEKEGVTVMGSLGVLEELYNKQHISVEKYIECLKRFRDNKDGRIRLPKNIIEERLLKLTTK